MADSTDNESISEVIPKALGKYLLDNVKGLREYYPEWPSAHERIRLPSVSIFTGSSDFRPAMPYIKSMGAVSNSASEITYVVGHYDFNIQMDLWTGSKGERDDIFDSLFNALNPNINPMGLELTLEEYFSQLCSYTYVGHTIGDSEQAAQRDEWRMTLNLLATCKAIRTKQEFVIEDVQTQSEIEEAGEINTSVVVPE